MSVEPISPTNLVKKVPDIVVEAFNELIAERWNGRDATFTQDEAIIAILQRDTKDVYTRASIFKRGMLDIEPIYEPKGWNVEYDRPGYNESYKASFVFSKSK